MRTLLLLGLVIGVAFMAGWFTITRDGDRTMIEINKSEIRNDTRQVIDRGREVLDRREQERLARQNGVPTGGQPGYAGQPSYATQPGYGTPPGYANQPAYGAQPGYGGGYSASVPATYGQPASYPSQPNYGASPNYPSADAAGQSNYPGDGGYPVQGAGYQVPASPAPWASPEAARWSGSTTPAPWEQTR